MTCEAADDAAAYEGHFKLPVLAEALLPAAICFQQDMSPRPNEMKQSKIEAVPMPTHQITATVAKKMDSEEGGDRASPIEQETAASEDHAERIRSEQETAASEDLEAIRALAAAADGDSAIAMDESAERHDVTSATAMDTTTEGGTTSADTENISAVDASSANKGVGGSKSAEQTSHNHKKRPPETEGATHAEDEARHSHSHSHHHEWLAERHAHTRVGTDFQVAALPTPHPHHPPTGAGGNGANGSGGGGGAKA